MPQAILNAGPAHGWNITQVLPGSGSPDSFFARRPHSGHFADLNLMKMGQQNRFNHKRVIGFPPGNLLQNSGRIEAKAIGEVGVLRSAGSAANPLQQVIQNPFAPAITSESAARPPP